MLKSVRMLLPKFGKPRSSYLIFQCPFCKAVTPMSSLGVYFGMKKYSATCHKAGIHVTHSMKADEERSNSQSSNSEMFEGIGRSRVQYMRKNSPMIGNVLALTKLNASFQAVMLSNLAVKRWFKPRFILPSINTINLLSLADKNWSGSTGFIQIDFWLRGRDYPILDDSQASLGIPKLPKFLLLKLLRFNQINRIDWLRLYTISPPLAF